MDPGSAPQRVGEAHGAEDQRPMFYSTKREASVTIFIGKPIPTPDWFLSRDSRFTARRSGPSGHWDQ